MTRIDFYVLDSPSASRHDTMICRIIEKAWRQGHEIYVCCEDTDTARTFDDILWSFEDVSFIPHEVEGAAAHGASVVIGTGNDIADDPDVLVNLAAGIPASLSLFNRVVESAGFDDRGRDAARRRYRHYADRGYVLTTHKITR